MKSWGSFSPYSALHTSQTAFAVQVAVPPECKDTAPLTEQLSRAANALDPRYRCVIHYDLDFYNEQ